MISPEEMEAREQRRVRWLLSMSSVSLILVCEALIVIVRTGMGEPILLARERTAHALILLGVLGWLIVRRSRVSSWECLVAGLLVFLPLPFFFWRAETIIPPSERLWNLLAFHRLVLLMAATLFPGTVRMVTLMVSLFAVTALAHAVLLAGSTPFVWGPEAWITVVYSVVAGAIVLMRAQLGQVQRKYHRARAALLAMREMATAARALRDGVNTPLQSIELVSFIERRVHPPSAPLMDKLDAGAARVRTVIESLKYEEQISWADSEISFQAERRLTSLQEALARETSGT